MPTQTDAVLSHVALRPLRAHRSEVSAQASCGLPPAQPLAVLMSSSHKPRGTWPRQFRVLARATKKGEVAPLPSERPGGLCRDGACEAWLDDGDDRGAPWVGC